MSFPLVLLQPAIIAQAAPPRRAEKKPITPQEQFEQLVKSDKDIIEKLLTASGNPQYIVRNQKDLEYLRAKYPILNEVMVDDGRTHHLAMLTFGRILPNGDTISISVSNLKHFSPLIKKDIVQWGKAETHHPQPNTPPLDQYPNWLKKIFTE